MRRAISACGVLAILLAAISLSSFADGNTWTGWISDSHCGAKGMNAGHKACAQTCVKSNGASWVFVDSTDKRVYPIQNQAVVKAESDLGREVTVTGMLANDGTLRIGSITAK